jgi:hypothetical protein
MFLRRSINKRAVGTAKMDNRKSVVAHGSMMSLISVFFQHEGNRMAARRVSTCAREDISSGPPLAFGYRTANCPSLSPGWGLFLFNDRKASAGNRVRLGFQNSQYHDLALDLRTMGTVPMHASPRRDRVLFKRTTRHLSWAVRRFTDRLECRDHPGFVP